MSERMDALEDELAAAVELAALMSVGGVVIGAKGDPTRVTVARFGELGGGVDVARALGYFERGEAWARAAVAALRGLDEAAASMPGVSGEPAREALRRWLDDRDEAWLGEAGALALEWDAVATLEELLARHDTEETLRALGRWLPEPSKGEEEVAWAAPRVASLRREVEDVAEIVTRALGSAGDVLAARVAAVRALCALPHDAALGAAFDAWELVAEDREAFWARDAIIRAAASCADAGFLPIFLDALGRDGHAPATADALLGLGTAGVEAVIDPIARWREDRDMAHARQYAVRVATGTPGPASDALLHTLLDDRDQAVKHMAAYALASRGDALVLQRTLAALADPDPNEQDEAREILARHPAPEARAALARELEKARAAGDDWLAEDIEALLA